ncbi:MAG: flagellar FliJ family protein [Alphaproteobacteria bacterium]|nr:flagellar FliJ family protein [Alphaproteobacteria bacterium]
MAKPALPTLIRLAAQAVEYVQQQLAANQAAQQAKQAEIATWRQEISAAFAAALTHNSAGDLQAAGLFQSRGQSEIARAEEAIQQLKFAQQGLLQQLQAAYTKQKRYELLAEQQAAAARQAANRKAQAQLDDLRRPKRSTP